MLEETTGKMMQFEAKMLQTNCVSYSAHNSRERSVQVWRNIHVDASIVMRYVDVNTSASK